LKPTSYNSILPSNSTTISLRK